MAAACREAFSELTNLEAGDYQPALLAPVVVPADSGSRTEASALHSPAVIGPCCSAKGSPKQR